MDFTFNLNGKSISFPISGFAEELGIVVEEVRPGFCKISAEVTDKYENYYHMAHGGFIAGLMDFASGIAGRYAHGEQCELVTVSSDLHYLLPIPPGPVECTGKVERAGRRVAFIDARVYSQGRLAATGTFTFMYK